jgi:hypothetical protein
MLKTDFKKYSLALIKDDKIIHSSKAGGLRPLAECVQKFIGKTGGCTLHDKVVGLAAARIIAHSRMIDRVITLAASKPAAQHLREAGIALEAGETVECILNRDRTQTCPMEQKALAAKDDKTFYEEFIANCGPD